MIKSIETTGCRSKIWNDFQKPFIFVRIVQFLREKKNAINLNFHN